MVKKIFFILILVFSILFLTSAVYAGEVKATDSNVSSDNSKVSSKAFTPSSDPIKQISTSKSTFKAGTIVKIKVVTSKSVKSVSANIAGKGTYKLKKSSANVWQHNLKTKGYKTGKYKLNIKVVDFKKKSFKKHKVLNVDNIPPKIRSISSNVKVITAGNPFYIEAITDKTSKKVVAKVRGKTIPFKLSPMSSNGKVHNSSNSNNWTLNAKINYKEIGTLTVNIQVSDSVGNVAKKIISIKSNPRYVYWNGTLLYNNPTLAHYSNPSNAYQKSINELSKYVRVYEGSTGYPHTLGITYNNGQKATRVIIAYKDPFVVYHEMAHVLNWKWSEYQCDLYAYKKVGYWII